VSICLDELTSGPHGPFLLLLKALLAAWLPACVSSRRHQVDMIGGNLSSSCCCSCNCTRVGCMDPFSLLR